MVEGPNGRRTITFMIDPLTLVLVGAGVLTFREMNRKDYNVLTPSRDERYRNAMEHCHQPNMLLEEARLFNEYGLKAQAAMLRRRAEWRARPTEVKQAHEEIYQRAIKSKNIPAILEVAQAFEGWTATKKASNLRDHVRELQEASIQEAVQKAANAAEEWSEDQTVEQPALSTVPQPQKKNNGTSNIVKPFGEVIDTSAVNTTVGDDT